jgi:hypothetical protein
LLNLEVGYLHPPVGLNLFITSVKFQRPITEVMWATIPFLVTMLLSLFLITYVPQLTAISSNLSPYDPTRTGRVADLKSIVHTAAEELTAIKQFTLVDAQGNVLNGADGKPIVKSLADCNKITDEISKGGCQKPFFDIKACKGKPPVEEKACTNKAIADFVVASVNGGDDASQQIVLVTEVPLIDRDGKPVKDKKGTPIVKKIADCEAATDVDTCRELFLDVSNCKITSPDGNFDACTKDKVATWVESNVTSE